MMLKKFGDFTLSGSVIMSLSPQFWVYCDGFVWDSWIANFLMPLLNPSTITKLNYFGVFADAVIEYRIFYL
jgi:hypothetical protein